MIIVCAITCGLFSLVGLEGCKETVDAFGEAVIDDTLVLQCLDLMPPMIALLVDLSLFGAYERLFVNIGMYFDVAVIG